MINWPSKTVDEMKYYGLDWGPALSKLDDATIVASSWTLLSGDIVIENPLVHEGERRTAAELSGGTADTVNILRNIVDLSNGNRLSCDAMLRVRA